MGEHPVEKEDVADRQRYRRPLGLSDAIRGGLLFGSGEVSPTMPADLNLQATVVQPRSVAGDHAGNGAGHQAVITEGHVLVRRKTVRRRWLEDELVLEEEDGLAPKISRGTGQSRVLT